MAGRSPLRFVAPIALLAFAFALYTVVKDARGPDGKSSSDVPAQVSGTPTTTAKGAKKTSKKKRKTYTVKAGDTASGIAAKTGVSVPTMQKLNKNFDPQTLSPGQRIRLSE
jgi:LysM repeat protein